MKKLIFALIGVFFANVSAFAVEDVPPLGVLMFDTEVVKEVSNQFFPDAMTKTKDGQSEVNEVYWFLLKQQAASADKEKKGELLDGECGGCVSGTDIVDACRKGGLGRVNSSKTNDLQRCIEFYHALCDAQGIAVKYDFAQCPATYDENGKRQNTLTSLGEQTRIGDRCGGGEDTNIAYGIVTLREGGYSKQDRYVCTCTAFRCKDRSYMNDKYQCLQYGSEGKYVEFKLHGAYPYSQFDNRQELADIRNSREKVDRLIESSRLPELKEPVMAQDKTRVYNPYLDDLQRKSNAAKPAEDTKKNVNSAIEELNRKKSEILDIFIRANNFALQECKKESDRINKEGGVKIKGNVFAGGLAVPVGMEDMKVVDLEYVLERYFHIICNPNSDTSNKYAKFLKDGYNALYASQYEELNKKLAIADAEIKSIYGNSKPIEINVFVNTQIASLERSTYLAQRYLEVQKGVPAAHCDRDTYYERNNNDFFECYATDGNKYIFEFDDAVGSWGGADFNNAYNAVMNIVYKGKVKAKSYKKFVDALPSDYYIYYMDITSDSEEMARRVMSDFEFVRPGNYRQYDLIYVNGNVYTFENDDRGGFADPWYKNPYGIDPSIFCHGASQFKEDSIPKLLRFLEGFVKETAEKSGNKVKSVYCDDENIKDTFVDDDVHVAGGTCTEAGLGTSDNVVICTVTETNGSVKRVLFLFDDLYQRYKKEELDKEAWNNVMCTVSGGIFNGKSCDVGDPKKCTELGNQIMKQCPNCTRPKWNGHYCELPDAQAAEKIHRDVRFIQTATAFVAATAITIASAGALAKEGFTGAAMVTIALVTVEVGGFYIETRAQEHIYQTLDDFIKESGRCEDVRCAKDLFYGYINYFGNYSDYEWQGQVSLIDSEMARLLEIIAKDEESMKEFTDIYAKEMGWFKEGGIQGKETHLWNPNDWNADQAWRALGITMQFATMGTTLLTKLLGNGGKIAGKLTKLEQTMQRMAKKAKTGENVAGLVGTADNIQLDKVSEIVLRNKKIAKEQMAYVRQVYNSGPEGKKWVELWDEYAPRNQSLKEFQGAFKNDLRGTEEYFEKFSSEEARRKRAGELTLAYHQKYGNTYADYAIIRDANVKEAIKNGKDTERLTPKTKGLESWTQEQIDAADEIYWAEWESGWVKNRELYSTYDPAVTNIKNEFKSQIETLDKEYNELLENYRKQHGSYKGIEDTPEYKELIARTDKMPENYQYKMAETVSLPNLDINAQHVANNFDNILAENADLARRFDRWDKLSMNEKESLFQDLLNAYAAKYGTPKISVRSVQVPVREDGFLEYGHYYNGTFYINTLDVGTWQGPSREFALQAVAHEYSHAIDHISPNLGSVGQQLMKQGPDLYTSKGPSYPLAFTEQSSYTVGGKIDARGNWPLENAVRAQENAIKAQENAVKAQQLQGHFEKLKQIGYDRDIAHKFTFIKSQDLEQALLSGKMREYANNILNKMEEIEKYIKNSGNGIYELDDVARRCSSLRKMLLSLEDIGDMGYKYGAKPAETLTETLQRFGMDRSYLSQKIFSGDKYAIEQFAKGWESNLAEIREKFNVALYNDGEDIIDLMNISKDIDKADSYIWKMKGGASGIWGIDIDELKKLIVQ